MGDQSFGHIPSGFASPVRRSARLNNVPGSVEAEGPSLPSLNASRRRSRRGKSDIIDTSAWSSSLYSARDPSQVSSYYLRPFEEDTNLRANGNAHTDDGSRLMGDMSGWGSLLRGAQRPSAASKSYAHRASHPPAFLNDYSEEEKFMQQVESQWKASTQPPVDSVPQADDSVFVNQHTPQVPGLFRSVIDAAQESSSAADDPATKPKPPTQEDTRANMFERPPSDIPTSKLHGIRTALFVLLVSGLVYYILYGRGTSPTLFSRDPLARSPLWSDTPEDLQQRVISLETAMNKVWTALKEVRTDVKQGHDKLSSRLSSLEQRAVVKNTVEALSKDMATLRQQHADALSLWQHEKEAWEKKLSHSSAPSSGASSKAWRAMEAKVADLEKQIAKAERQALDADTAAQEARRMVEPLKDFVPDHLPVRYDRRTKQVRIDPSFWHEFRKVMPSSKGDGTSSTAPSWSSFLLDHRTELDNLFSHMVHENVEAGLLIDKRAFLDLMATELARAKTELSAKFNENVHGLQNDVLAKVREQQAMYERSGSWDAPTPSSTSFDMDQVQQLIDAALAQFAADQIGRVDYAQYTAGGRVLPSLTSPTHEVRMPGTNVHSIPWMLSQLLPAPLRPLQGSTSHTVRGRMPVVALHHDTSPGMCWPFSGSHGQLGVQLVGRVRVSAVTIDHIPASLALDGQASAPRDMELWGLIDRDEDRDKVARWRLLQSTLSDEPSPVPPSPAHVFLGSFTYDASSHAPPIQTFPVGQAAEQSGLSFRVIQLHVLSNHGHRDYTCLYRVRIHGESV